MIIYTYNIIHVYLYTHMPAQQGLHKPLLSKQCLPGAHIMCVCVQMESLVAVVGSAVFQSSFYPHDTLQVRPTLPLSLFIICYQGLTYLSFALRMHCPWRWPTSQAHSHSHLSIAQITLTMLVWRDGCRSWCWT